MIDHTDISVSQLAVSTAFYQAALAPLGYSISRQFDDAAGFVDDRHNGGDPHGDFWISQGAPQTPRKHIAFNARNCAEVDAFHAAALAAGARDNGPPGLRPQYHAGYYAAFVFDPDGYNIEAVHHGDDA
ncbi:VOC family protein [Pigmentiphaga aceris]|uniref:VOC family protein n=1 Tax=Pigmentiphaga aceris TaxID=1940612 RepID=A0A5C0B4J3_9BURK|nr:VOC family protein [Pigmentiphaga aceris]QEI08904.1 VOC family protein [Pigmentiphaga aceris]